jgi:hypothetical protein
MQEQAGHLAQVVARFRLHETMLAAAPAPSRALAPAKPAAKRISRPAPARRPASRKEPELAAAATDWEQF